MMRPLTYGSIGQCAAAPFVFLTSAWVLGVFHSYRRQWLSVDLFLLAISVQELVMALQVFIYALMSLVQPDWDGACGALVWSLNATRTLQFATVMSLLADRALTCHWPYRYRFSVRRHQLRYHLAVLAAMASLLGVAALITRPHDQLESLENSADMYCATMPYLLNIRLSLFLLAVYGVFLLVGMLSIAVVQTSRGCFSSPDKDDRTQTVTNTTSSTSSTQRPPLSTSSTNTVSSHGRKPVQNSASRASSTSSSVGTGNLGLRAASSTADLLPVPASARAGVLRTSSGSAPGGGDFRWRTTVSVALLCCLLNHLPYLTLVAMGTFTPRVLPPFPADHLSLWLSVSEGLLLPLLLLTDRTFRSAVSAACRRTPHPTGATSSGGEAPFRLFPKDDTKAFPLTNGSLFSSLLSLPVEAPPPPPNLFASPTYRKDGGDVLHMGLPGAAFRALDLRRLAGAASSGGHGEVPYNAPYYCRDLHNSQDPLYSNPNINTSTIDSSTKEDHIYATLSETFGSMSSFSDGFLNDDNRCPSVTTVANDDFEFHDPRTSGCSIDYYPLKDRNPCLRQQSCSSSSFSSSSELLSYGSRVKDDDTLIFCSSKKSAPRHIGRRPPAELPPQAYNPNSSSTNDYGSRPFSISDKPLPKVPLRNHEADFVLERNRQNVMNSIEEETAPRMKSHEIGYDNALFESDTLEKKYYMQKHATDSIKNTEKSRSKSHPYDSDNLDGTLSRKHRVSSLSMSDLDRLERKSSDGDEDQMMFLLPVKSESMLSLYRLYLAEDEESSASLHYSIEVSKSENDLSLAWHSRKHSNGSQSRDDISSPHEIYRKRRRPQSSASKVRRQHKIQRAKGVHLKSKPPTPVHRSHEDEPHKDTRNSPQIPQPLSVAFGDHNADGGMRVAIVDKARRQNGIITIRDPSGLSVQELFSVLNRAATSPCPGDSSDKNPLDQSTTFQEQPSQVGHVIPTYSYCTPSSPNTVPPRCPDKKDTVIAVPVSDFDSRVPGATHEFRKIFLSEYL